MARREHAVRWTAILLMLLVGLVAVGSQLVGCATTGKPGGDEAEQLSARQLEQAQRLYAQLKQEVSLHRDRKVLEISGSLLDYYQHFDRNDEVLMIATEASLHLDDTPTARGFIDELLIEQADSPLVDQALLKGAEIATAEADTLGAADYLISYHDRGPARSLKIDGTNIATPMLKRLDNADLAELVRRHPDSSLLSYLDYLRVRNDMGRGAYEPAAALVESLEDRWPEDRWTVAARQLLSGEEPDRKRPLWRSQGAVRANEVGVLCPLTGRYAVLGNAFYDGALLALQHVNADTGGFVLKVEDTGGDPVASAQAARRLCDEDGSIALLGSLMSDPTVSAAVVADGYGVPLISPTATNDKIWQLGERIYQTNLTGFFEVGLLAQVATEVMLKERFAVLYPDNDEGRRQAEIFVADVEALGGEVVARAAFPPQATDFRIPILEIGQQRPEVIFVPATVDQMVLLGPQLDFYRAGALILGLSNWNSPRLLERAGRVLERAVFPSDLALFPTEWTADFNGAWDRDTYPREATALALKSYQSTRMLLDTLQQSGAVTRRQLAEALSRRMASRDIEAEGPRSYVPTVRMIRDERFVPFPAEVFTEAWDLTEGAVADSLRAAEALGLLEDGAAEDGEPAPPSQPESR